MPEDSRDETDHDLFRPALDRLFYERLGDLGDESCRDLLSDLLQSRWEQLAASSCRRMQRPMPTREDALLAFDALKHVLLGNFQLLDLNLPEVWRFVRGLKLRYWIMVCSSLSAALFAAFEFGKFVAK